MENTVNMKIGISKRLSFLFSAGGQVTDLEEVLAMIAEGSIQPRVQPRKLSDFPVVLKEIACGEATSRIALLQG